MSDKEMTIEDIERACRIAELGGGLGVNLWAKEVRFLLNRIAELERVLRMVEWLPLSPAYGIEILDEGYSYDHGKYQPLDFDTCPYCGAQTEEL